MSVWSLLKGAYSLFDVDGRWLVRAWAGCMDVHCMAIGGLGWIVAPRFQRVLSTSAKGTQPLAQLRHLCPGPRPWREGFALLREGGSFAVPTCNNIVAVATQAAAGCCMCAFGSPATAEQQCVLTTSFSERGLGVARELVTSTFGGVSA